MNWYIDLVYRWGLPSEKLYYHTRAEARRRVRFYRSWDNVKSAIVRKVGE